MTNYDRWKLATPDYLEDKDEIHGAEFDGEVEHDIHPFLRCDSQDEGKGVDRGHQKN
jgi:hypothetical protein